MKKKTRRAKQIRGQHLENANGGLLLADGRLATLIQNPTTPPVLGGPIPTAQSPTYATPPITTLTTAPQLSLPLGLPQISAIPTTPAPISLPPVPATIPQSIAPVSPLPYAAMPDPLYADYVGPDPYSSALLANAAVIGSPYGVGFGDPMLAGLGMGIVGSMLGANPLGMAYGYGAAYPAPAGYGYGYDGYVDDDGFIDG
jgi:hypothetical protein